MNPSSSDDQQPRRETIFDDNNANTSQELPKAISQINDIIKTCEEYKIAVVWEDHHKSIGVVSNLPPLEYSALLANAVRRMKMHILRLLEV